MAHDHESAVVAKPADVAPTRTVEAPAEQFVHHVLQLHPHADPETLAEAIATAGRANDPRVISALHRALGNATTMKVVDALAHPAKARVTASATKSKQSVGLETGNTSADGTQAMSVEVGADVDKDRIGAGVTATDKSISDDGKQRTTTGSAHAGKTDDGWAADAGVTHVAKDDYLTKATSGTVGVGRAKDGALSATGSASRKTSTEGVDRAGKSITAAESERKASLGVDHDGVTLGGSSSHAQTNPDHLGTTSSTTGSATLGPDKQAVSLGSDRGISKTSHPGTAKESASSLSVGVNFSASRVEHEKTKDGRTEYTMATHVEEGVSAKAKVGHFGASGGLSEGEDHKFIVNVPEAAKKAGVDLKKIDLGHLDHLPIGGFLRIDSSAFKGSSLGASIDALSLSSSDKHSKGTSLLVERRDGTRFQVTAGPTEVLSRATSFGVSFGPVGAALLGSSSVESATLISATFDLSADAGKAAYEAFTKGTPPTSSTPGAEDVQTIEKVHGHGTTGAEVHLASLHLGMKGKTRDDSYEKTTKADGSTSVDDRTLVDGRGTVHQTEADAKGATTKDTFTLLLKDPKSTASLLGMVPGAKTAKGKELHYELSRAEIEQLFQLAQRALKIIQKKPYHFRGALDILVESCADAEEFILRLSTWSGGSFEEAQMLYQISDVLKGKEADAQFAALPGKVV